jgi:hypothetical protein
MSFAGRESLFKLTDNGLPRAITTITYYIRTNHDLHVTPKDIRRPRNDQLTR